MPHAVRAARRHGRNAGRTPGSTGPWWLLWLVVQAVLAAPAGAAEAADELVYLTRRGDTLIGIGERLLRQPRDWPKVQRHNRIANPRRLPVGARIAIPAELLRLAPAPAKVLAVTGTANGIRAGDTVAPGGELATAAGGYVTVELADGSTLTLQPRSRLRLEQSGRTPGDNALRSRLQLLQGRVEVRAAPQLKDGAQQLRTPATTLSVRGTRYRAAVTDDGRSLAEVTEGRVVAAGRRAATTLEAGQGIVARPGDTALQPTRLLPAPDLAGIGELQERITLRLTLAPVATAHAYRMVLASDPAFHGVVGEQLAAGPEFRLPAPPDGQYWLRGRAIAGDGLEGLDAVRRIEVRARPEPPFLAAPAPEAALRGERVALSWAGPLDAVGFRLQLAPEGRFEQPVRSAEGLAGSATELTGLPPGRYAWRMASVTAAGRLGPWSDPQSFTLRPPPPDPPPPTVGDDGWHFSWPAEPGQRFEFELARDERFEDLVQREDTREPRVRLPRPQPGVYFMRVRAIDPDGLVGPYTATRRIEVPAETPWWLLLLLLPLL